MPLTVRPEARIAIVRIAHGPVNAMDLELCTDIAGACGALAHDRTIEAVVLCGNDSVFSAGVDLKRILAAGDGYTGEFLTALATCFLAVHQLPKPTVAAVGGHAIAGGCVLACACDHVIAADGPTRIGLTELAVGAPFPTSALEIIRGRVHQRFGEVVLGAATYPPREALEIGFVDEVVAPASLAERATAVAARLARIPASTYALTKQQLQFPVRAAVAQRSADWEPQVHRLWSSAQVRAAMRRFVRDTLGS
jgi:enoyl-CoA hydratase